MLVAGVTIILIGVFRVLTQHQFLMAKAISDLQISNQSRGELAKQLRLQSEKLQERSSRLETLNDVTQNVMRQLTMDDMLSYIMRRAADLVQANHTSVLLQDREGENLIIHYGRRNQIMRHLQQVFNQQELGLNMHYWKIKGLFLH